MTHKISIKAATIGNPKFFLGTDSASYTQTDKNQPVAARTCITAFHAIKLYTEAFDKTEALDKFEGFTSYYDADFYELPRNTENITLTQENWHLPNSLNMEVETLIPLHAGEVCEWKLQD